MVPSASLAAVDYGAEVQPLFAEYCYACHGPDDRTRKAGLRFDRRGVATGELESGARAIVPGDVEASELWRRLTSDDPDVMMPPPDFRKRPTQDARETLRQWIAEGAAYTGHWAFEPVTRPEPPAVSDDAWARNPIDRFVLARLEAEGLEPSRPAGPESLLRRLSLDLRGLPPAPGEMDLLALDDKGPMAYARAVEHMMSSAHYGERMAQDWLDLARYGDTNGYHNDSVREMWLYRDYVIASFNANKPFDRFIVENMAGDLLPDATEETRVASGFHRCATFNEEGGADPDEFHVAYAVDRANTVGQVFLGLTIGCAQCHDHKYDPISQKEYYQLYAFFNSVEGEIGAGGRTGYHNKPLPPLLSVKTPEHRERIARLDARGAALEAERKTAKARPEFTDPDGPLGGAMREWAASLGKPPAEALPVRGGLRLHLDAGELGAEPESGIVRRWHDRSGNGLHAEASGEPRLVAESVNGRPAVRLDGKGQFLRTRSGSESLGGDFTIVLVLKWGDLARHQMALMWGDESQGKRRAFWKTDRNRLSFNGYGADVVGGADIRKDEPIVAVITQRGADNDTRFRLNGKDGGGGGVGLSGFENRAITIGANNAGKENTAADFAEVLVYERALDDAERSALGHYLGHKYGIAGEWQAAPAEILAIATKAEGERGEVEKRRLFAHFVRYVHPASRDLFRRLEGDLAALSREREQLSKSLPTTMVMVEMKERKPAHVLMRGDYQQPAEAVLPDVPAIFPRLPGDKPRDRLGLAYWLTDREHPLVARVTVNRMWKQFFGVGLVKTMGDFGVTGERPSHPLLLDWLAAEFMDSGWDVQQLQRVILDSATYRQSSARSPNFDLRSPAAGRLLARAPRFRLSAEEIRDSALAISGLLDRRIGGPSVMPPQPAGYLSSIGKSWKDASGADRHRRGLYTFWRRTMLYPSFQIFDAPSREFCTVDRPRTNTPLQALVTLNDPVFVEAARAFGERIRGEGGEDDVARLRHAFRLATAREPSAAELAVLQRSLAGQREHYAASPDEAKAFAAAGDAPDAAERAAWAAVAGVLLNLDEVITRE